MSELTAPVAGAAVVCLSGDSVLLVRRGREPNRGRWSFPGGKIEVGETARAAAARETLEETGLKVRVLDVVDVYDALFPPYHYCVVDYLAVPEDPETQPQPQSDVMDARWVPVAEVGRFDVTEAMEQVLARALWLRDARAGSPPCLGLAGEGSSSRETGIRGLYVITDETLAPGRTHLQITRAALSGGAQVIQLRDKRRDAGELLPIAREAGALCRRAEALFIVNDRVDLAAAAGADGVHLGQTDLPVAAARRLLGPDGLIGISVENEAHVRAAEGAGADYLGVGAIYGSATKRDAGEAVGPEQIRRFRAISFLPIVAIGGITAARIPEVRAAGADSVAVISAVAAAPDPEAAARELAALLQ